MTKESNKVILNRDFEIRDFMTGEKKKIKKGTTGILIGKVSENKFAVSFGDSLNCILTRKFFGEARSN